MNRDEVDNSGWEELGLLSCPLCGAMHKPGAHHPETCATVQRASAMKRSLIEADLLDSDDVEAIQQHMKRFEQ